LHKAAVAVQRAFAWLRPDRSAARAAEADAATTPARSTSAARTPRGRAASRATGARRPEDPLHRRLGHSAAVRALARVGGHERVLPVGIAGLVLVASILSVAPATGTTPSAGDATGGTGSSVGDTSGVGDAPRLAVGGIVGPYGELDPADIAPAAADAPDARVEGPSGAPDGAPSVDPASVADVQAVEAPASPVPEGPYLADGTLLKPVAVDTTVPDGSDKLAKYTVRSGDTLTGIASRFGISMMTVWWANDLSSKDRLHVGQTLLIPQVTGVVVKVQVGDTLASIAKDTGSTPDAIVAYNGLNDTNVILGQVLVIPGGRGDAIATPAPKPQTRAQAPSSARGGGSGSSGGGRNSIVPPSHYGGGTFAWPVPGGYVSQYFHYGHWAIDIAGDYGSPVRAAAAGTVIFAGWKSNGGGYQVWISHGSNLYTTYNHMSAVTVGVGQSVGRDQQVGRLGASGDATGPHCHFEVWVGAVWAGGSRVNPMRYL
jgi:murein DD-endopeptidase MepM/ murein hydrolase activator NlpD